MRRGDRSVGKFVLFASLYWLTGSPIVAVLILLVILYLLDLRFVRLLPNLFRPFILSKRLSKLTQTLRLNPYESSAKIEVARIYMEKRQYHKALQYLQELTGVMGDSAEFICDLGICHVKIGEIEVGEEWIKRALDKNPRVKYGEPYLHLSEASVQKRDIAKALTYLEELRAIHSSSVEVYYKMGRLYLQLDRKDQAGNAFVEAIDVYKGLPTYKKRIERRWALLSLLKTWGV